MRSEMKILYLNKRDVQPEHGKTKPFEFKTEDIERAEVVDGFLGTKHGYECYLKLPEKKIEVLKLIVEDMKNDAEKFDGQPFNGKTVAEYFGNQGAAIAALADIICSILEEAKNEEDMKNVKHSIK